MKKTRIEIGADASVEDAEVSQALRLRKRPVANLTEEQMEDAAGGHPHHTCEPTCPRTCCPTCPATCRDHHSCAPTCVPTCDQSCAGTCHTCGEQCDI